MSDPAAPAGEWTRAGHDDVDELVSLVESAYRGDASRVGWTTEADLLDGQRIDAPMLRAALDDPSTIVLVRRERGAAVACCEVRRTGLRRSGFGMFAVAPDRQGRGLGDRVLARAEQVARDEWGSELMTMTVIELRTELVDWYLRRGYSPTGEVRPFPYADERFGRPRRDDLRFVVLAKPLGAAPT